MSQPRRGSAAVGLRQVGPTVERQENTERKEGWQFALEYDTDLFDQATAERWLGYLEPFAATAVDSAEGG